MGKNRSMSICLSDIPKERIISHTNGKLYLPVTTYDYDAPDKFNNDFSVSIQLTKEEIESKKAGNDVMRVFIGNGKIWPDNENTKPATTKETDDLPF